jgi:phosphoribosylamine---glycine ligase
MPKEALTDILITGRGGREHALGWKLRRSPRVGELYFAPGNAGTEDIGKNVDIGEEEIDKLAGFASDKRIGLTIIGPETPLAKGIRNQFDEDNLSLFGHTQEAALLESSKAWAANFQDRHNIPHPLTKIYTRVGEALNFIESADPDNYVLKADGLCGGKGVVLPKSVDEARDTVLDMMVNSTPTFGEAGRIVVVQEKLVGRELSVVGITDGRDIRYFAPAVDHKTIYPGGPNTGGTAVYAPDSQTTSALMREIHSSIMQPAIDGMKEEGCSLQGALFAGVMITEEGPKVLEFNVRFGGPETQAQMILMQNDLFPIRKSSKDGTLSERRITQRKGAAVGVVLMSGGYPGKYETNKVITGLYKNFGEDIVNFEAGTRNESGVKKTSGGRVVCVTGFGKSVPDASEKVYSIVDNGEISFDGVIYRKGVGIEK